MARSQYYPISLLLFTSSDRSVTYTLKLFKNGAVKKVNDMNRRFDLREKSTTTIENSGAENKPKGT